MATVNDVPAEKLITRVAETLKGELVPPDWAPFAKTGVHKEKGPENEGWWHVRAAAVLRKVYLLGPIGTERLAAEFGGKRDRGSAQYHARKGSRSVVRHCLRQLEHAKYVSKFEKRGRMVTAKGRKLLDNSATTVLQELVQTRKELEKYA